MSADDKRDFTTLNWVKGDLDDTFGRAREALEAYVDEPDDDALIRECAGYLHQIHGTLRMVEMYGAAMVVDEMESVANALAEEKIEGRDEAYTVLMRGLVQTPDYLERIQGGYRDIPVVLLPLLNDLRAARGQKQVSEAVLFAPDLSAELPDAAPGAASPLTREAQRQQVTALRTQFQMPLLTWMRNPADTSQLPQLREVLDRIGATCQTVNGRRLWWIAGGVLEGLEHSKLDAQRDDVRPLFGRVDRAIKQLIDGGEMALVKGDAEDLARQMLYHVAQARGDSARMQALRHTYRLDEIMPDEEEVEHAQSAMSGHNRALLDTVSGAIKEDLLRVKDALDIFMRRSDAQVSELEPQMEVLDRVADTLGMLGLPVPSRVVEEQYQALRKLIDGSTPRDEHVLLDIAGALLFVESSLDDHIESLGQQGAMALGEEGSDEPLGAEARRVHDALMAEAQVNLGKVKHDITAFVEVPWDHGEVEQIPALLQEIAGAMRMLEIERPAALLDGVGCFVNNELIVERRIPTAEEMEHLADALAALEYYLEAAREHRSGRDQILDLAERGLALLRYWPVPEWREPPVREAVAAPEPDVAAVPEPEAAPAPEPVIETVVEAAPPLAADGAEDGDWIEIEEEIEEEVPVEAEAMEGGFQTVSDEIDEDIREVFVEEFEEEIDGLGERVIAWKADPENLKDLKDIRRTFHTLKGSGRLVGAVDVGEFSWKVENMLNRVLDGTIKPSEDVIALLDHAVAALPELLTRLKGGAADASVPIAAIMQTADALAEGGSGRVEDIKQQTRIVRRIVKRRVPRPAPEVAAAPPEPAIETDTPEPVAAEADEADAQDEPVIAAPVLPPIDPVLLDILRSEVEQHVGVMQAFCAEHAGSAAPVRVPEHLLRSVHTLSGAVAMVDIPALVRVLSPLESCLKRLRGNDTGLSGDGLDALAGSARFTQQVMAEFASDAPQLPDSEALVARLVSLRDSLPEPPISHPLFGDAEVDAAPALEDDPSAALEAVDLDSPDVADEPQADDAGEETDLSIFSNADDDAAEAWLRQQIEDAADAVPPAPMAAEDAAAEPAAPETTDTAADADASAAAEAASWLAGIAAEVEADETDAAATDAAPAGEGMAPWLDAEAAADAADTDTDTDTAEQPDETVAGEPEPEAPAEEAAWSAAAEDAVTDADAEPADAADAEAEEDIAAAAEAQSAAEPEPEAELEAEPAIPAEPEAAAPAEAEWDRADAEVDAAAEAETEPEPEPESEPEPEPEPEFAPFASGETVAADADAEETADETAAPAPAVEAEADDAAAAALASADIRFPHDPQPEGTLDVPDLDADLLEVFVEEAGELLDEAEGAMAALHGRPQDQELVAELQRGLHTLKGGARMAGLAAIGDLGHVMESLLQGVTDGKRSITATTVTSLEHGFDLLHELVQRVRGGRAIAMPQRAIAYFDALVRGEEPAAADADADVAAVAAAPATEAAPASAVGSDEQAAAAFEARTSQELIRVRADLLDTLVNAAGEVSIYRARLEEQISSFRFNLLEFEQTTSRLREQLRKMEIETEAQIIARYQREQEEAGSDDFDPLELDRFSQLQQYSRSLAESVSDLMSIQGLLDDLTRQSETLLLQQSRVSSDLQEGLMRTRMVPFDSLVPGLRRTLRQAAQETGKRAQLRISGAQGEMDRNLLERIKAPFEHMLRNAMVHGIESPGVRTARGKPAEGTVSISVRRDSTEVVISVSDDGGGINLDAVRQKAIERGLMKADAALSSRDIYAFMLETGFSTASEVTKLAGRGVGLDVVASEIKQLGGSLTIDSEPGQGTTFTIRLPFTLAVTQAILVSLGESTFAVPMASVQGVARIAGEDLRQRLEDPDSEYTYAGEDYRMYDLARLLDMPASALADNTQVPMLMTQTGDQRAAVRIDRVVGSREIVVKPVGPQIGSIPGIFGASIMGDGSVVMILDLAPLVRRYVALRADLEEEVITPEPVEPQTPQRLRPLVMVVDDSITMRKVTTRTLERNDLDVLTAKDGLDAVEKLQDNVPDLMLLDIEMPRMDGYELATYMRNDERLKGVPIIMVTSRTGEKHRQRALELGVKRYLGKPYQEADLLSNIKDALVDRV